MTAVERASAVREQWPLLSVQDIGQSIRYYRDLLGFELADEAKAEGKTYWCRLRREGACIMLQQAEAEDGPAVERGRGVGFFLVCDDADLIYTELTARDMILDHPKVAFYGMKQLFVPEPDGYSLCFESPTTTD